MNNIRITAADNCHIDGILDISSLSFPITWSRKSYEEELTNGRARYVVALIDDKVIGFGGMWIILDEAHITNIAVHPQFRGSGIGSMLLQTLIDICRAKQCLSMTLEVRISNKAAQALYGKYGFIVEGKREQYYEDNKEDALLMWKRNI
jgi:[ribosomal protein S18]-alanine N-acetyltransferase